MKRIIYVLLALSTALCLLTACQSKQKDKSDQLEGSQAVEISTVSQQAAGIKVSVLEPETLPKIVSAPGEVVPNADLSSIITTKVQAQVVKRLVQVGQNVTAGQPLVVLSSVEMAKAQGDALMAEQEWARMKSLGKEAVSAKRYAEADVAFQQATAKLVAYGMTADQVKALLSEQSSKKATGEFELLALKNGTVFEANGVDGALIEPGTILFNVVNKASLWVDARVAPAIAQQITIGTDAWVKVDQQKFAGKVLQVHPQLDEITRTQIVRIEISTQSNDLRPGQFVECEMKIGQTTPVLAVPSVALMQSPDNDWIIYVESKPEHFLPQEVKVVETIGDQSVIAGIKSGTRIVTQGAFFVHSELGKGNLDTHGH